MNQIESEFSAYIGKEPYVFVSYPHEYAVRVESVLRLLHRQGIRFWYDDGIPGGEKWSEHIDQSIADSRMFLCFLANGVEQRPEVVREIRLAIRRHNSEEDYPVVFLFLEWMSANVFEGGENEDLREFINSVQYFHFDGITEDFVRKFFGRGIFPDDLVREEFQERWQQRAGKDVDYVLEGAFSDNPYICRTTVPEWDEAGGFYQVRLNQIDPDAACLICLDNQWCPVEFYADPEFQEQGLRSPGIADRQAAYQRQELYRALLHDRQIIVNRAYLFNSRVFYEYYQTPGADREAFRGLLKDGSLLIFLTGERTPYDAAVRPRFAAEYYDLWGEICASTEEYCLRMDWRDDATNRLRLEQLLFGRFGNFCLTMRENRQLLEDLETAFAFEGDYRTVFEALWNDAQQQISERSRSLNASYTRELFYKYFIVKDGTDVSACIIDPEKPLAPVLKEIVDFQYGLNLPEAIGARALYPPYGHLKEFYRSTERLRNHEKEIALDVLTYALDQFETSFLNREVSIPDGSGLSLAYVKALRDTTGWQRYMRSVTNGRKRARLQEVDFADIAVVWQSYYDWLEEVCEWDAGRSGVPGDGAVLETAWEGEGAASFAAPDACRNVELADGAALETAGGEGAAGLVESERGCTDTPDDRATAAALSGANSLQEDVQRAAQKAAGRIGWCRETGSVTILFRLGLYEITAVYHGNAAAIDLKADPDAMNHLDLSKDHTVLLTIDYLCTDILRHPQEKNPMIAELRLFEGITKERLSVVYAALLEHLEKRGLRTAGPDPESVGEGSRNSEDAEAGENPAGTGRIAEIESFKEAEQGVHSVQRGNVGEPKAGENLTGQDRIAECERFKEAAQGADSGQGEKEKKLRSGENPEGKNRIAEIEDFIAAEKGAGTGESKKTERPGAAEGGSEAEGGETQVDILLLYDMSKKRRSLEWRLYEELMRARPTQFRQDPALRIETDLAQICHFEHEQLQPAVKKAAENEAAPEGIRGIAGMRYRSPYSMLVTDLVVDDKGKQFLYERTLPAVEEPAVVCITVQDGKFVLLEQFRHSMRKKQLAFVRGYGESGLSGEENAKKEIGEELGAEVHAIRLLGEVVADSGKDGSQAAVYYCEITGAICREGYEGIIALRYFTPDELKEQVRQGKIDDGFTLAALQLLSANHVVGFADRTSWQE